jgi:2-polyprenyl-6-methoxyphenol hydroxylase-like FAD-dependent oxidoreductase
METDVLIVGAGPVGLSLAADLGSRGVACVVVEARARETAPFPTANHISVRSMEHLRRLGLSASVEAAFPDDRGDWVVLTHVGGVEIARVRNALASPAASADSPQHETWCPKPFFDPILERAAHEHASVTFCYQTRVDAVESRPGSVRCAAQTGGDSIRIEAKFAVACDGAASCVRESAGIGMRGPPPFPVTVHSAFFRSQRFARLVPAGGVLYSVLGTQAGPTATPIGAGVLVSVDGDALWRLHGPGLDANSPVTTLARLGELGADDAELLMQTAWTPRKAIAERFRSDNLLLAGDAAHVVTPFGGLGVNTGIGDAFDLGWKLEATLAGWGGARLLEAGYEFERGAAARTLLLYQGLDVSAATPTRTGTGLPIFEPPEAVLWDAGAEADAARHAYSAELIRSRGNEFDKPGVDLGTRYDGSPLIVDDGSPPPTADERVYSPSGRPGGRAPHVALSDGSSSLDWFGRGFTLVRTDPDVDPTPFERAAGLRGIPMRVRTLPDSGALYGGPLVLVRPDGVVAWRGPTPAAGLETVLDQVCGR